MKVTLKDVANAANVSLGAASRVISGSPGVIRISAATEKRVLRVARKLNYKPNILARGLKSGKSSLIGVVLTNIEYQSQAHFFLSVERCLTKRGYGVIIQTSGCNPKREEKAIDFLMERSVEGFIICSAIYLTQEARNRIKKLENNGAKMVLIGGKHLPEMKSPFMGHNDYKAGYLATHHLIQLGHEKIVCLTNTWKNNVGGVMRLEGYERALEEAGISVDEKLIVRLFPGTFTYPDVGYKTMARFLKSKNKFSAIFVHCDTAAVGVLRAIKDFGLNVPEDIAIVSVDNEYSSKYILPSLTTILLDDFSLGRIAVESLCKLLKGEKVESRLIEPKLIIRESSGAKVRFAR